MPISSPEATAGFDVDELLGESVGHAEDRERTAFDERAGRRAGSLVLFGAGRLGRRTLAHLRAEGVEPVAFADNDARRWGGDVDGVPVLSPDDAARRHGRDAVFVVTIWGAGSPHRYGHSEAQLHGLGVEAVSPFSWLAWKHAERMLPYYALDLPSRVLRRATDVERAATLFTDPASRRQYAVQLRWRLTGSTDVLDHPHPGVQYLADDLWSDRPDEVIVDCGAYDGDTLQAWLAHRGTSFRRYLALEPDPGTYARLEAFVASLDADVRCRVTELRLAVAAAAGQATFTASGTGAASLGPTGDVLVDCARLDDLNCGGGPPTWVKMDIEGAEPDAVAGAATLIASRSPVLAICVYHAQDHLWRVPAALHDLCPEYRFTLRPHNEEGWDLVLYAVPPDRWR